MTTARQRLLPSMTAATGMARRMRGKDIITKSVCALLWLLAANSTAFDQSLPTPPRPPLKPPGYCLAASAAFLDSESKAFDELKKCVRGDTVVIPAKNPSVVARMCDFSKAIVTMADYVVCVLVIPERDSKQ
jgi:hypothetical protein